MTIEDIILSRDRRGISALRPHLPADYADQAAELVLEHPGTALIVTGFYILSVGAAETDGPPGAVAIGEALQALGYTVAYITDTHSASVMAATAGSDADVVDFPIADEDTSRRFADALLADRDPSVVVAIERCGLNAQGRYRNMHGRDITEFTARTDYLLSNHPYTVGIGDGGNELGMGSLAEQVVEVPSLVKEPCVTAATKLVISSVSNWGGYGLVAALSKRVGRDLLPSVEAEQDMLRRTVDAGAVDGMSTLQEYKVDGFTMDENSEVVGELHVHLAEHGVNAGP